ncbi:MAG TPA: xanthine dehydrogenase iron sulfur-binding subunit XdhC [Desulfobacterales bacterium]|nr:xanthine dehydrogenase iron sulfur-binding subunit XdhC [Desulfobacterales bacterium]
MQTMNIKLNINTRKYEMDVDVRKSLMDLLRELGYTSVKHGCGVGECGACTVLVDDIPIDSCLYLAVWANNTAIRTTEGECRDGKLSTVQNAYVEEGAVQCGFCTPGLIMTSTSFLEKNKGKDLSHEEIRIGHAGNLCRCTGYQTIINAVESASKK